MRPSSSSPESSSGPATAGPLTGFRNWTGWALPRVTGRWQPWLLLLAMLLLFLPVGGLRDWWYPDEPDVALPAIEMAARGDWVVPTHNGASWLDYPPLAYWGVRIVGVVSGDITPWGSRVPMVLFACLMVAATMWLGQGMGHARRGLGAGVILIATPAMWFHTTNLQTDLGYAAFITLGLACYYRAATRSRGDAAWLRVAAFACFGVAILGKGPLGVLLPGLILTCWHLWNREWRRLLMLAPLALIALAVALPWYLLLCDRLGVEVVMHEVLAQNSDRFGSASRGHGGKGAWYYLTHLPPDLGWWILLLIPALWRGFRHQGQDRSWRLLAVWILAPLIFFTLASTRRSVYLLPIFPALALLIAGWLEGAVTPWEARWQRWSAQGLAWTLALVGAVLLSTGLGWHLLPTPARVEPATMAALQPAALVIGSWLALSGAWLLRLRTTSFSAMWSGLAIVTTLGYILVLWLVFPVIDTLRSYRPAAEWLAERVPEQGVIGFHLPGREGTKRPAWLCHLDGRHLEFLATPTAANAWLAEGHHRLLLTAPTLVASLREVRILMRWRISSTEWVLIARESDAQSIGR